MINTLYFHQIVKTANYTVCPSDFNRKVQCDWITANVAACLRSLPEGLRDLSGTVDFRPVVSTALLDLTAETDRELDAMLARMGAGG